MPATISPLPTPPSRQDPANFTLRADQFLAALPTFATEANNLANEVNTKTTQAANSATAAANSATQAANSASAAANSATAAANSAASAVNSPGTSATSTTSLSVSTGSKSLTVQTNKAFVVGQPVMIARTSAPSTTWMHGKITSYNSSTGELVVDVELTTGSGTFTDWTISLSGPAITTTVNLTGNQTIDGVKTFNDPPVVPDGSFTFDKIQNIPAGTILGRASAGAGDVEALTGAQATALLPAASETVSGLVELATDSEAQTGTDTGRAVTPANLRATVLGMGQTWRDVTASRALATTYTNTTGRTIAVAVIVPWFPNQYRIEVGGLRVVELGSQTSGVAGTGTMFVLVPPGATYQLIRVSGSSNFISWAELR